ncbi:putative Fe-Mo cluster-binding NifX family protein [Desulfohalotomaculum tongense]|uniref:NifB/NifX family molybdenum-iron cluster-binding protein n=1 Tax=Desulforadius tongensis TaxID=1216062 RepID=UPI00195A0532|nr:NifB/NifX family molybdenum-iron cluster-binding protein [Desulforadius tongensis]MBM7853958.1 putative Fe-Mo cluster-binding NifX family protein [Desulforadius tongensis]
MKIAISSQGDSTHSQVNPRLGRCEKFIIYDTDTGKNTAVDNGGRLSSGGAGIATARMLADLGVNVVITGFVGPKAFAALKTAGIKVYTGAQGTVEESLQLYQQNKLEEAQSANAGAHSGI